MNAPLRWFFLLPTMITLDDGLQQSNLMLFCPPFFADLRSGGNHEINNASSNQMNNNIQHNSNSTLLGHQQQGAGREVCPSCGEPFDNGKKRRLIDNCGHERCYTCMFSKELCSLCTEQGE